MVNRRALATLAAIIITASSVAGMPAVAGETKDIIARLTALANGDHRSPENRARNIYRHPAETLAWFGIRDDMTVVEISPGGGWYTEILAPFLKDRGTFYAAGYDPDSQSSYERTSARRFLDKLAAQPDIYANVKLTIFNGDRLDVGPEGAADMVLTFRNLHNWMRAGFADKAFAAFYRALKPGGILGVVEHRANTDKPQDPEARSGYVREDYVIALAKAAGFEFVGSSEINANPRDRKDYAVGVWALPPSLNKNLGGKYSREQLLAIGESDRMTLKFRRPRRP